MRTAVVTGAGSGLGRAIAHELARRGYRVWAADLADDAATQTAAEINGSNADSPGMREEVRSSVMAQAARLDVRDEAACRALADSVVAEAGALDLWVNNAGVFFTGAPWEQGTELRQLMLDVNATGLINGTLAALAPMIVADRGQVINIVSLAGLVPAPGEVVYSASKHAAMAFTLGTQFDLHRSGIRGVRVSAVCPDGIWTPMIEDKLDDPESAGSFSGELLTAERVASEVGKLTEGPRPVLIVPRWRGVLRLFTLLPRLSLRMVPLIMWDARRRQRRYKRKIESGRWP